MVATISYYGQVHPQIQLGHPLRPRRNAITASYLTQVRHVKIWVAEIVEDSAHSESRCNHDL